VFFVSADSKGVRREDGEEELRRDTRSSRGSGWDAANTKEDSTADGTESIVN